MLTKLFRPRPAAPPAPAEPQLPPEAFKGFFARQASTVSVITFYIGRHLHGFTATSVTPVSMVPPLALFCIAMRNTSHRYLHRGSRIGISFLAADQAGISARFADKAEPGGYTDIAIIEQSPDIPLVRGAVAGVEGSVTDLIPAGDHTVFLCRLGLAVVASGGRPLLYHARAYYCLGETAPTPDAQLAAEPATGVAEICAG